MEYLNTISIILYFVSSFLYFAYLCIQKENLSYLGYYLLLAGFICHTLFIGLFYYKIGYFPVYNLHGTLNIASWSLALVFVFSRYKFNLKILGVFAAPLISLTMIISFFLPCNYVAVQAILKNVWVIIHVIFIFLGEGLFALAFGIGVLYLLQEHAIKNKIHGFFFKRLPSLELLDTTGYTCIITGFWLMTTGLILGFFYAKITWGKYINWDPKEIWSIITWLIYAILIYGRLTLGWQGKKSAFMAIFGFIVILFTFLGVNFFLQGHHGVFTK